jgi:hypothetical protein
LSRALIIVLKKGHFCLLLKEKKLLQINLKKEVDIPKGIRNKVAEIFLIRFNEGYQDADIEIYKRVIRRQHTLKLQTHGDKTLVYFVMVEPKSTFSIYNRVE